ncbi:MAG TPA: DUF2975 domain-containing protein [Candidatus Saccharimonadales bacterium]|nr:DUF2975 domain-containing protein [Candidatus Saccharimonadales bacterium]
MPSKDVKRGSTLFLRLAVSLIGLGVLALCVLLLPVLWLSADDTFRQNSYVVRVAVCAMYAAAVLFYAGVYQGWQVLNLIDKNQVFSLQSVKYLHRISYCAAGISLIYAISLPFFFLWAQGDDAPGLGLISVFLIGVSLIISVAMGLLGRLLDEAVRIKSENDLTV